MFERFDQASRAVVVQARDEARMSGATKLEAEHLLLALSARSASDAGRLLAEVGLDHEGVRGALEQELRRSLAAAGVTPGTVALADAPMPRSGEPRWGASAKRALQRALEATKARGDRSLQPTHILIGVLRAEEGTVPRALAGSGVDTATMVASAEAMLDGTA